MLLKIVNKNNDKYYLVNKDGKKYEHHFRFFDLINNPNIGDYIEIKDVLLDKKYEEYDNVYLFGALDKPYGRNVKDKEDNDVILLYINKEKFYLKRFFG